MKILLFSDLHYLPGVFPVRDERELIMMQEHAERTKCDLMIHAGDFCHGTPDAKALIERYNSFRIPSYHCLGNHDTEYKSREQVLKDYRMPGPYYYFDVKKYRIVVMDTNYYLKDGVFVPYERCNYQGLDLPRAIVPPEQLTWLRETIASSEYPVIIISHASFEREADGVVNAEVVREIIREANANRPHSVLMCINGHYHRNHVSILDNVCFFDLNAVSFDWVEREHDLYPPEVLAMGKSMNHIVAFTGPVFCVLKLEGTDIRIRGVESSMLCGVTREMTGNRRCDASGRAVMPRIPSSKFCLL